MSQTAPRETILVTGDAGFIGMHVCQRFLDPGYAATGIDNRNSYYGVTLKESPLVWLWTDSSDAISLF